MRYQFYPNLYFNEHHLTRILSLLQLETSCVVISWHELASLHKQHLECLISLASVSNQPNTNTVAGLAKLFGVTPGFVSKTLKHARPALRVRDFYYLNSR